MKDGSCPSPGNPKYNSVTSTTRNNHRRKATKARPPAENTQTYSAKHKASLPTSTKAKRR